MTTEEKAVKAEGQQDAAGSAAVEYPHMVRGVICAFVGACCWGYSGTCSSLMTGQYGVPVLWITCVRLLLAAALFLAVIIVKDYRSLLAVLRDGRSLLRIKSAPALIAVWKSLNRYARNLVWISRFRFGI